MSAISTCFLWLVTYSFGGWVIESFVCSLYENKPVNRGFLKGPVCPVYGFGALITIAFLYQKTNQGLLLFLAGAVLDCAVEYVTAVLLEKLFHAKWWDYSDHRFNFQGRICLSCGIAFGILSVLLVKQIHPVVLRWTDRIPDQARILLAFVIFLALAADLYKTLRRLLPPDSRQEGILALLTPYAALPGWKGRFDSFWGGGDCDPLQPLYQFGKSREKRMMRVFPKLKFISYRKAWQKLKNILKGPGGD